MSIKGGSTVTRGLIPRGTPPLIPECLGSQSIGFPIGLGSQDPLATLAATDSDKAAALMLLGVLERQEQRKTDAQIARWAAAAQTVQGQSSEAVAWLRNRPASETRFVSDVTITETDGTTESLFGGRKVRVTKSIHIS